MARIPRHIGIIPDGNRRWAVARGLGKEAGYASGLMPGLDLFRLCRKAGVQEVTFYGFTVDNTKRPGAQTRAFTRACIEAADMLHREGADLLVIGNTDSPLFPRALLPYTGERCRGRGDIRANLLVNYGWEWDIGALRNGNGAPVRQTLRSCDISRIDLIIRWGGRRRLSGFLPVQSVYSDFYVLDEFWPDFQPTHFHQALDWYRHQDVTLGG